MERLRQPFNRYNRSSISSIACTPFLATQSLPNITAQSYAIYDMKKGHMIHGRKENLKREIASLTKIMTFYTVYDIIERNKLSIDEIKIKVTSSAANVTGTTAALKLDDTLSVRQLLYGLMLPSGNDAAYLLAEYFGELLSEENYSNCIDHSVSISSTASYSNGQQFVGSW
jgi:D-alanyl-D-alanine carboxypeptidase